LQFTLLQPKNEKKITETPIFEVQVIEFDTGKNAPLVLGMVSSIGPQPVLGKVILK